MVGGKEVPLMITVMAIAGLLSAFANNIAATAVLMPAVASIAYRSGLSPSRLFMPLSFGAIFGGTMTMVGTPPNILAAEMLRDRGLEPFSLFDFTPLGLVILGVGIVFMITIGRRLLPDVAIRPAPAGAGDLAKVYQLHERLFSLEIPPGSSIAGKTLAESRIGATLHVQVVAVLSGTRKHAAPNGTGQGHGGAQNEIGGTPDTRRRRWRHPSACARRIVAHRSHPRIGSLSRTLRRRGRRRSTRRRAAGGCPGKP
jgi:di/tricarboxylate transporter